MKLKSFGCSFIYGADLPDTLSDRSFPLPSQLTWPALLAQNIGHDYECHAHCGSGNLRILEQILTHAHDCELCVVGWTWIDRFDYTAHAVPSDSDDNNAWKTLTPTNVNRYAANYYRDLHSQYRDKLTTLIHIKLAIDTFKQRNIPFIMTYMDDLIFETDWHCNSAVQYLQQIVQPHMTTFDNKTFLEFSKEKGFAISQTLHPLEDAHRAAFELIHPKLDAILHKA
jgi:hypothetical protein